MMFISPRDYSNWLIAVFLLSLHSQGCESVKVGDCIAEKFYKYSTKHTACISKSAGAETSGITASDQKLIVDKHNELRGRQSATNMQRMVWDDEIAAIAHRWAENCEFEHDKERRIPGRFSVGQNLAAGYDTWDKVIQGWYDEIDIFTYGNEKANVFSDVGHYTQLVWAESAKIGCAYTYCSTLKPYNHLYVCNYGPSGNLDWSKPYKYGSECADCPGKCSNNLCDCGGKVCGNGGILSLTTCACECDKSWQLPKYECSLNCSAVKEPISCQPGGFYDGKCAIYTNVPDECPEACNVCPYAGFGYDVGKANSHSESYFLLISLATILIIQGSH